MFVVYQDLPNMALLSLSVRVRVVVKDQVTPVAIRNKYLLPSSHFILLQDALRLEPSLRWLLARRTKILMTLYEYHHILRKSTRCTSNIRVRPLSIAAGRDLCSPLSLSDIGRSNSQTPRSVITVTTDVVI